jgi:hypothetical protein
MCFLKNKIIRKLTFVLQKLDLQNLQCYTKEKFRRKICENVAY